MKYVSTRGTAPAVGFETAMLSGLAPDGGLYVPAEWPRLADARLGELRGRPYAEIAAAVIAPFVGDDVSRPELAAMIGAAYGGFGHPAVAPLRQVDAGHWLLELFHGPTLAFKDVALQLVSRLMERALERTGASATVVCATSGDTGGAAIAAFRPSSRAAIVVLHPEGRVSDVQRRQMTTVLADNVHNIAVAGSFDDCQALVKAMLADAEFRDRTRLAAVNSINWARILAQAVYYVAAGIALGAPDRDLSFAVPTGNFGNVFAGYVARQLGLPIRRLVVATNVNDILDRALSAGRYEVRPVASTLSPSMDIQVSSNFERLLFEAGGRDAAAVRRAMAGLKQSGSFTIDPGTLAAMRRLFSSGRADEEETLRTMREWHRTTGEFMDPHTAVGYAVAS
ncbi:MAG TPA: threonine synthase, partial [Aestuariivirgaceae bacterium]|nr:threonine synthase [Aestuariivirgaceae bacterium]